jgi:hypothetical protein
MLHVISLRPRRIVMAAAIAVLMGGAAFTATPATATPPPLYGCNYGELCLYRYNYQGMVARMSSCTWHDTRDIYFTSYVNNQTPGTRGRLYDFNRTLLSYTKPALGYGTTSLGLDTAYVRPC